MKILVSDPRQDLILQEFVDQGKWKNASDQCEKRIKKQKKGTDFRLQLNHLMIELKMQLLQGDLSHNDLIKAISSKEAFFEYLDVCDDLEFIEHIEDSFDQVGGELWKRASKERRNDEDFFQAWFDLKFRKEEFREAAEACMHWRVNFPQKGSELTMRMIMCYHLSSMNASSRAMETEKGKEQRDRDSKMALNLLRQAAKGTPAKTPKVSECYCVVCSWEAARIGVLKKLCQELAIDIALRSSFDLELLVDVFTSQGLASEAIQILIDPVKGLLSSFGCWDLVLSSVRLLYAEERWSELFRFAMEVLSDAIEGISNGGHGKAWQFGEAGDDILIYDAVVAAARHLKEPARTEEASMVFQSLAGLFSLNARLALVKLQAGCGSSSACVKLATNFFTFYKSKVLATSVIPYIPKPQRKVFLKSIALLQEASSKETQAGEVILQMNCLRAKYELGFGPEDEESSAGNKTSLLGLQGLIIECIWTYAAARAAEPERPAADNSISDPALMIAARALVALAGFGDLVALHQARLLLQCLLSNSRYNYEASVLLVRIYISQGAVASALPLYKRLEIKNLQQINEAGVFFNGIATLHGPQRSKSLVSPAKMLDSAIAWTAKRRSSIKAQSISCVDTNDWTGACRAVAFASEWVRSPGYISVVTEAVRLQLRNGEESSPHAIGDFLELVSHYTQPGINEIDILKVPEFQGVRFSHDKEAALLDYFTNASTRRFFWETLLLFALQTLVRDTSLELSSSQLYAIIYQNRPRELGPSALTPVLAIVRETLQQGRGRKLNADSLKRIDETVNSIVGYTDQFLNEADHTEQEPSILSNIPYAGAIRSRYEAMDAINLAFEAVDWLDRRHTIGKQVRERLCATIEKSKATIVAWAKETAGEVVTNSSSYAGVIASGKIGEAVVALAGEDVVSAEMQSHCQSVAESLQGLIDEEKQ